jgi:hypothetical protein
MQYTIRNIPEPLDAALRRTARNQGKSLNDVAIEALARGAGISGEPNRQRDLSDIAGRWREDPLFDSAVSEQDVIDGDFMAVTTPARQNLARIGAPG